MPTANPNAAIPLSRPFPCLAAGGTPTLDRADPAIFRLTYYMDCMGCGFCRDACCRHGADADGVALAAWDAHPALAAAVPAPREEWLAGDWVADAEYPGGGYVRTARQEGACVFLNREGRGCRIHSFALERGIAYQALKPMACSLFPLTWHEGLLRPSNELLDRDLVCIDQGPTIYRGARGDLLYFFGPDLVAELDGLEAAA